MGLTVGQGMLLGQGVGAIGSAFGAMTTASATKNAMQAEANITAINAKAAKDLANAQADILEIDAQNEEFAAQQTLLAGQRNEQNVLLKTGQLKSTQRASMAANGIDMANSPTAINILTSTDVMGNEDAKQVALEALRSAWGHRTQATNYRGQAGVTRAGGTAAELIGSARSAGLRTTANAISPAMAGASSLLTSASSIGSKYLMMKSTGLWDNKDLKLDDFFKLKTVFG